MANMVSVKEATTPVIGYIAVAYTCLVAGNIFREVNFKWDILYLLPNQFLFLLLLIPFYLNRVIVYEQKEKYLNDRNNTDKGIIDFSLQFPFVVLVFVLLVFIYLRLDSISSISFEESFRVFLYNLIALVPFYAQIFRMDYKLRYNKKKEDLLCFRFYIFFPAISTCMISFIFGWANFNNLYFVSIISLLILLYWSLSIFYNLYSNIIFGAIAVLIITTSFILSFIPIPQGILQGVYNFSVVFSTAFLMTLVMGITESWCFIKDHHNFNNYSDDDKTFYKMSVNKATAVIPFIFPTTFLFPNSSLTYSFLWVFGYSLLLYFIWFFNTNPKGWTTIKFIFGIIAPILISIFFHKEVSIEHAPKTGLLLSIGYVCIGIIFSQIKDIKALAEKYFLNYLFYTVFISFLFLSVPLLFPDITSSDSIFLKKVAILSLFYLVILIFVCALVTRSWLFSGKKNE